METIDIILLVVGGLWALGLLFSVINCCTITLSRYCYTAGSLLLLAVVTKQLILRQPLTAFWGGVFSIASVGIWLLFFGLITACIVSALGCKSKAAQAQRFWQIGLGLSLFGAIGVFSMSHGAAFLVSWELMSFGGAVMVLADRQGEETGRSAFLMLGLLEVGAVLIVLGVLAFAVFSGNMNFLSYPATGFVLSPPLQFFIGLLFFFGFGAKLGLLPFYEWFPEAYGSGGGTTGALFSGLILNAGYFALMRALLLWLPATSATMILGIFVSLLAVLSAIMAIMYGYQQTDWRRLLSLSSAENASIAVLMIGVSLIFRAENLLWLAGMSAVIGLIHMAAHTLAKGCMFFTADALFIRFGTYRIEQLAIFRKAVFLSIGALLAALSLAAMPPLPGFLSEWYAFQAIFHGFKISGLAGRIVLTLCGAGLALSSAIAIATFIKVVGIGLTSGVKSSKQVLPNTYALAIFVTGVLVLALAVGLPTWVELLTPFGQEYFGYNIVSKMHTKWLMIPLSKHFAFASPPLLIIVIPIAAIIPLCLLAFALRHKIRREKVWYGGRGPWPKEQVATTAFVFSNALRNFYTLIYKPVAIIQKKSVGQAYFTKEVVFRQKVTYFFDRILITPLIRIASAISSAIIKMQSGNINLYNGLLGIVLLLALASVIFW